MAVFGKSHRVDFYLRGVLGLEDIIKLDKDVCCLVLSVSVTEAELLGNLDRFGLAEPFLKVDGSGDDGTRVLGGDLFDVHTALCRSDENDTLRLAIIQNRDIIFMRRFTTFGKHDL